MAIDPVKFRRLRSGQAFMELALGMLALALVMAALFGFSMYIFSSLDIHRELRAEAGWGRSTPAAARSRILPRPPEIRCRSSRWRRITFSGPVKWKFTRKSIFHP
jgi:hypothetical protein